MINDLRDKIWHRDWTDSDIQKYVGDHQAVYLSYAADDRLRQKAASGGSVTALHAYLLNTGQIDGVLALRTKIIGGKARPEFFIAADDEELIGAQGSKYSAVFFTNHGLPIIEAFPGKLSVTLLPCDAKILHSVRQQRPDIDQKIAFVITLYCGHNSEPTLADITTKRLQQDHGELKDYTYRFGHWRGKLKAEFEDGTITERPFQDFSDYRNVYFFAQRKCHHCFDHFGYYSDLSAGDIWSPQMRDEEIKYTSLIVKSDLGKAVVESAIQNGVLKVQTEPIVSILNGQARTLPFHYNVTARARVARLFGIKIRDEVHERVRWNDYLVAFLAILNQQVSATTLGAWLISRIPRPLVRAYVLFFKGLESF